jgi:D-tyrosyl-tRNA(Tyr) deacylase
MRCVVQRVRYAKVSVDGEIIAGIGPGLCAFVGVGVNDNSGDVGYVATKLAGLRVFVDAEGKMNWGVTDIRGELLLVSQFTLFGDVRHGRRPSFTDAADPVLAKALFEQLAEQIQASAGFVVKTGRFQAHMDVELANDGPVTVLIDSHKNF